MAIVLVPGLLCTPQLYAEQIVALWQFGPVTVADHRQHNSMSEIAASILAAAPPSFALAGLSMGGYIALEMMRQAPERITRLALLDTSARADTPAQTQIRQEQIALARAGKFEQFPATLFPLLLHRKDDPALRAAITQMALETGAGAFIRQQQAIGTRMDSRPSLANIRCPTWVLVGAQDKLIPPDRSQEIAEGIVGAHYEEIPESGHLPTLEQPALTTQALIRWLES